MDPSHGPGADPILVPVDFSPHSEAALLWAADLARITGATLHVLHVVHDPGAAPGYYDRPDEQTMLLTLEERASRILEKFLARLAEAHPEQFHEVQMTTSLVTGLPASRILEVAKRIEAGHIVMGCQGRTGLRRLMLGSKAERVVRLAKVPVSIIKVLPDTDESL